MFFMEKRKALLGAGCFWGIEEYFRKIEGIINTKVGYSGGDLINPSYEDVCTNTTRHVEVVLIGFDKNIEIYFRRSRPSLLPVQPQEPIAHGTRTWPLLFPSPPRFQEYGNHH